MIFDKQGVPLKEVLQCAALTKTERALHRKEIVYDRNVEGERIYRIVKNKLGDVARVFRALWSDTNRYNGSKLRGVRAKRRK